MAAKQFVKAPRYLLRKHNILRMVKRLSGVQTFVDVGCGAGELANTLGTKGYTGIGLDFSESAIATANQIGEAYSVTSQVRFEQKDVTQLIQEKKQFDLVICCEVLEHVEDDGALLNKLIAASKGYLIISVPAKQKLFDDSDAKVGHYRRYEQTDLRQLLESHGLKIMEFSAYGYPLTSLVRILRKPLFKRTAAKATMDDRSKESGINPVALPAWLSKINMETAIKPFYWFSLLFNRFNLSEGYVVLAKLPNK